MINFSVFKSTNHHKKQNSKASEFNDSNLSTKTRDLRSVSARDHKSAVIKNANRDSKYVDQVLNFSKLKTPM